MQWNANYRVVKITKLNIVKPAYCQAEGTDKKMSKFWSSEGHAKGNQIERLLGYCNQRCMRSSSNWSHQIEVGKFSFNYITKTFHLLKKLERFPERDRGFSRNVSHVLIGNMIKAEKVKDWAKKRLENVKYF